MAVAIETPKIIANERRGRASGAGGDLCIRRV